MFSLQNMTYEDFINANTNYKDADKEEYLWYLNISVAEEQAIAFEDDEVVMYIDVFVQDEVGKGHELINCEKVKL